MLKTIIRFSFDAIELLFKFIGKGFELIGKAYDKTMPVSEMFIILLLVGSFVTTIVAFALTASQKGSDELYTSYLTSFRWFFTYVVGGFVGLVLFATLITGIIQGIIKLYAWSHDIPKIPKGENNA